MRTTTVIVIVLLSIASVLPLAAAEDQEATGGELAVVTPDSDDCLKVNPSRDPPIYWAPCP